MIYVAKTGSTLSIGTIIASDRDQKEVLTYQLLGENYLNLSQWSQIKSGIVFGFVKLRFFAHNEPQLRNAFGNILEKSVIHI